MANNIYPHRKKRHRKNNLPLIILGAGLLLIGIVSASLIANQKARGSSSGSSDDYSVTPSVVNFPAPQLTLNDLNGNQVSLSDHLGFVVLVNNWATWCPPCKAEMPTLQTYYTWHAHQGFTLLAIEAGEPLPEVAAFAESYQLTFPVLLDPNNLSLRVFNNDGLPNSYVIDRQGTVRLAWTGPINLEMLERFVTPLLEE